MQLAKESPQELVERIAGLTTIAEKHGVTVDILVPYRETLLMIISRCGTRATLEAKHMGESFSITLHESNPRGASGSDFEGMIKAFCQMEGGPRRDGGDEPSGPKSTPRG